MADLPAGITGRATLEAEDWKRFLKRSRTRLSEAYKILLALYGTIGYRDIIKHFENEEGPRGKWKKRSRFTQEMYLAINKGAAEPPDDTPRAAFNPNNKILSLSGDLKKSIMPSNSRKLTSKSILVFSPIDYSGQHNRGDASKNLPQRQFLWLSEKAKSRMVKALASKVFE